MKKHISFLVVVGFLVTTTVSCTIGKKEKDPNKENLSVTQDSVDKSNDTVPAVDQSVSETEKKRVEIIEYTAEQQEFMLKRIESWPNLLPPKYKGGLHERFDINEYIFPTPPLEDSRFRAYDFLP